MVADSVGNCGRRHLRDGERRRDGVSTTAEWPPPVGKKQSSLEALTPSNPGHQRSLQRVLCEEDQLGTPNLDFYIQCHNSTYQTCAYPYPSLSVKALILDYFPDMSSNLPRFLYLWGVWVNELIGFNTSDLLLQEKA